MKEFPLTLACLIASAVVSAETLPGAQWRCPEAPPAGPVSTVEVSVDFRAPSPVSHSMVGFVHGADADTPGKDLLEPLAPSLWRSGKWDDRMHDRVRSMSAREIMVMSDGWGYPPRGRHKWPYEDPGGWSKFVETIVRRPKQKDYLWEVWNEPDHRAFWGAPDSPEMRKKLFETYVSAFKSARRVNPAAQVGGPAITHFQPKYLEEFLQYAEDHGAEVNFLTWHDAGVEDVPGMPSRVRAARAMVEKHPALRTRAIFADEAISKCAAYWPGDTVGFFYYAEKSGVDGTARTCWGEPGVNPDNCYNNTLEGLLEPKTFKKRSVWWAYKAYADGWRSRVASEVQDEQSEAARRVGVLASASQVVIGYMEYRSSPATTNVALTLKGVAADAGYRLERIPLEDPERKPFGAMEAVRQGKLDPGPDGTAKLSIDGIKLHDAYVLTLVPGSSLK